MNRKLQKILMTVLLAVFVFSSVMLLRQWLDNESGETGYEDAIHLAMNTQENLLPAEKPNADGAQPEPGAPAAEQQDPVSVWVPAPVEQDAVMTEMANLNIAALREVNPDVLGWIRIPDTKIDYPLLQGEDNDFYLNHTWEKVPNSVGSIFLEHRNSAALSDYNTIIYGHNMGNGSMFAALEDYAVERHWQEHPYVYILTDLGVYRYEIFAFYRAEVDSLTYGLNPLRSDTKEKFLNLSLENSWIDTGIKPAVTDRILTLSTCSGMNYDHRYVVQARLVMVETTG